VITDAIPETVGGKLIGLVTSREEIPDLLKVRTDLQARSCNSSFVSFVKLEPTICICVTA